MQQSCHGAEILWKTYQMYVNCNAWSCFDANVFSFDEVMHLKICHSNHPLLAVAAELSPLESCFSHRIRQPIRCIPLINILMIAALTGSILTNFGSFWSSFDFGRCNCVVFKAVKDDPIPTHEKVKTENRYALLGPVTGPVCCFPFSIFSATVWLSGWPG